MHRALEIARTPVDTWGAQIADLPEGCTHSDCGAPRSCRERIAEYMRMQWRIEQHQALRREEIAKVAAAKRAFA
jgi:hypothetical protein